MSDAAQVRNRPWAMWQRFAFRFAFVFWVLLNNGLGLVLWVWPWLDRHVSDWLSWPLEHMALWVGTHIFFLSGEAAKHHASGSGDKALDWVEMLCSLVVALIAAALWSAISEVRRKRLEYHTLYAWLRLVLRFTLASALLGYGFLKVFPLQMPPPSAEGLAETYGASSPMHLAWTFIGASTVYRIFAGLSEVIPGLLLFFKRTSTVGAMAAAAVFLNVFLMNMGYDIPVKLYSGTLLAMAIFLLLPDLLPMWRFFVLRRPAELSGVWVRRPERKALRCAAICLQIAVAANLLYGSAWSSWKRWHMGQTALKGVWTVDAMTGALAAEHWGMVRALYGDYLRVGPAEKSSWLRVEFDSKSHEVRFLHEDEHFEPTGKPYAALHWNDEGAGKMKLTGMWNGQAAGLMMHRSDPPPSLLMSRGFHWVQEYPFNR